MPRITVTHGVDDLAGWLDAADERAETIGKLGGTNVVDQLARDGSSTVAVSLDTDDVEGLITALTAPGPEIAGMMKPRFIVPPVSIFVAR
jgi:hypothetical protein